MEKRGNENEIGMNKRTRLCVKWENNVKNFAGEFTSNQLFHVLWNKEENNLKKNKAKLPATTQNIVCDWTGW